MKPEAIMAAPFEYDVGNLFGMSFPAAPAAATESSFTGSTGSEPGSPAKKLRSYDDDDDDSSVGSGAGGSAALELGDELAFDPFMLLQLPYESLDGLFASEAVVQDVNNDMNGGVNLWSFDEFPLDSTIF